MKMVKDRTKDRWADHYTRRARKEHYPARSVYKLQEIQTKYGLIRRRSHVLDLGCAPGAWLLYAAALVGEKGLVAGIDRKPLRIQVPGQVKVFCGDIFTFEDQFRKDVGRGYHVVLSDLAPDTTGSRHVDAARSQALCEAALAIAQQVLQPGGAFVCKIFQGADFQDFRRLVAGAYQTCRIFKPRSSRKASREIYIVGLGKRQEDACPDIANGRP